MEEVSLNDILEAIKDPDAYFTREFPSRDDLIRSLASAERKVDELRELLALELSHGQKKGDKVTVTISTPVKLFESLSHEMTFTYANDSYDRIVEMFRKDWHKED